MTLVFDIRQGDRIVGVTADYATAAQFFAAGYDVSGFNWPPFVNPDGNR